ncbi:MAG: hypothetical protein ABIH51_00560 [Patescibacteria group bacterium]
MLFNKKKLIILSIFGLVFLVLFFLIIYPLLRGIKKDSENYVTAKKDLVLFRGNIDNLKKIKQNNEIWKPNINKIDDLFIDSKILVDFIKFLEKIARDSNVLIDISPGELILGKDDSWSSMNFQIIARGSFIGFSEFFEKIEASPYLINVQNLTIEKIADSKLKSENYLGFNSNDIRAVISIKAYAK